jgi:O-antigen ligase
MGERTDGHFCRTESIRGVPVAIAACAAASALVPIHPSVQLLWIEAGLPSTIGVLSFLVPVFFFFSLRPVLSRLELGIVAPFFIYAAWMLITSLYSPAIGMLNWWSSVRGLAVVLPVMVWAACIAARDASTAARVVIACGVVAAAHYSYLLFFGAVAGEEAGGFGAIGVIDGIPNYQATAFFVGIAGVWALSLIKYQGKYLFWGLVFLALTIFLMATAGARSSLVGLAGVIAVSLGASSSVKRLMFFAMLALIVSFFAFVILLYFNSSFLGGEIFQGVLVVERFLVLSEEGDSSHRLRLFTSALEMWLDSPVSLLVGGGLAAYPYFTGQFDEAGWYPHNFILESLAEGGLIAVLPLLVIIQRLIYSFPRGIQLNFDAFFLRNFALYSCFAYMFMGGVASVWIPFFALSLCLFSSQALRRSES